MSWFNGLYSYEIVLLVLGAILFLVSLVLLIYQVTHAKALGSLALFFGISVAMIGYPSIQQIQFSSDVVTITKSTEALQADPTDAKTRELLQQDVSKLAGRAASGQVSPQGLTVLATAQYALDDEPAATATLAKALQANPVEPEALALKSKISAVQQPQRTYGSRESRPVKPGCCSCAAKVIAVCYRDAGGQPEGSLEHC